MFRVVPDTGEGSVSRPCGHGTATDEGRLGCTGWVPCPASRAGMLPRRRSLGWSLASPCLRWVRRGGRRPFRPAPSARSRWRVVLFRWSSRPGALAGSLASQAGWVLV